MRHKFAWLCSFFFVDEKNYAQKTQWRSSEPMIYERIMWIIISMEIREFASLKDELNTKSNIK